MSRSHYRCCLSMRQPIVTSDNPNLIRTHTMIERRQTLRKFVGFYFRNCRGPLPVSEVSNRGRLASVKMMKIRLPSIIDKIIRWIGDMSGRPNHDTSAPSRVTSFNGCHSHLITHLAFSWTMRIPLIADIAYKRKSLRAW